MKRRFLSCGILAFVAVSFGAASIAKDTSRSLPSIISEDGQLQLPDDFRSTLTHIGTWHVPDGPASGLHDVYMDDASVAAYRSSGEFPDGTVIVKELRGLETGNYTTGQGVGYAADSVKQWFLMVKDRENRFPDNALWGDGWGWGLFKPDAPSRNLATNYQTDCLACHVPARATDLIYIEAYPTLKGG